MLLKNILQGTTNWLRSRRYESIEHCGPALNGDGLLIDELENEPQTSCGCASVQQRTRGVQTLTTLERREPAEEIQEGFNRLVDQLQQINNHLGQQLDQHEELMSRVRQLPQLLESFPQMVESQRKLGDDLVGQIQMAAARQEQFLNAVGQIPTETARQTRTLGAIHHQLEQAAQTDTALVGCFNEVGNTLNSLSTNTADNTAGMRKLRRSAAARDRYMTLVFSKFQRRIIWLFAAFAVLCVAAVSAVIGLAIYLRP
jgi:chromosome segregation ATPase